MVACEPWLRAELEAVSPDVLVLLGATAAQALLGPTFSVTRQRGRVDGVPGVAATVATMHPSAILRARDEERREQMEGLVADLRLAAGLLR
jgi:DNA polymerase